jgi:hypothetical protein
MKIPPPSPSIGAVLSINLYTHMQVHFLRHCCFVELLVNAVYVLSIPLSDFLFRKSIDFLLTKSSFLITRADLLL